MCGRQHIKGCTLINFIGRITIEAEQNLAVTSGIYLTKISILSVGSLLFVPVRRFLLSFLLSQFISIQLCLWRPLLIYKYALNLFLLLVDISSGAQMRCYFLFYECLNFALETLFWHPSSVVHHSFVCFRLWCAFESSKIGFFTTPAVLIHNK